MEHIEVECTKCSRSFSIDRKDLENEPKLCCPACGHALSPQQIELLKDCTQITDDYEQIESQEVESAPIPFEMTFGM